MWIPSSTWRALRLGLTCLVLVVGSLFGWFTYKGLVGRAHTRLHGALSDARVLPALLGKDPTELVASPEQGIRQSQVVRTLQLLEVVPREVTDPSDIPDVFFDAFAIGGDGVGHELGRPGLDLVLDLAAAAGQDNDQAARETTRELVLLSLAGMPGVFDQYRACVRLEGDCTSGAAPRWSALWYPWRKGYPDHEGEDTPWEPSSQWGMQADHAALLGLLFEHYKVGRAYATRDDADVEDLLIERDQLRSYAAHLLLLIEDDREVASARLWLAMVQGPEQLLMVVLLGALLALLALRIGWVLLGLHDRESFDETSQRVRQQRWIQGWLIAALPSIGFVGTVRGLSAALGDADTIVRAVTDVQKAAAIDLVSSQLGLAFTTTLVALVFGLFASLFERGAVAVENGVLPAGKPEAGEGAGE